MPKRSPFALAAVALAVVALAACGSSYNSNTKSESSPSTSAAPSTTGGGGGTTVAPAGTATVALATVDNAEVGNTKVLVDDKGMTLYVWDQDTKPGVASCVGACAKAWPPLVVTGTPTYGTGVDTALFSTVKGPNGEKQLAVNGKPLYLWAADKKAGEATGDGVNGFYVVAANGNKVDND